jgi:hypothetical protein
MNNLLLLPNIYSRVHKLLSIIHIETGYMFIHTPTVLFYFNSDIGFDLTIKFFSLLQSTLQTFAPW